VRDVTVVKIDLARCINCSLCRRSCPTDCIHYYSTGRRTHVVEPEMCIGCDICVQVCPVDCIDEDPDFVIEPAQLEIAKDKARAHARSQHNIKIARKERALAAARAVSAHTA
jgi:Na+-translocating ferredoxin:NAD+ oxidoreductase RNF subunit RnfB